MKRSAMYVMGLLLGAGAVLAIGAGDSRIDEGRYSRVMDAIIIKESTNGKNMYGDWRDDNKDGIKQRSEYRAVGWMQMWKILVDDTNEICKRKKWARRYTYQDRMDRAKCREMFIIVSEHYSKDKSLEVVIRRWNGGPTGEQKESTATYLDEVKKIMDENGWELGGEK